MLLYALLWALGVETVLKQILQPQSSLALPAALEDILTATSKRPQTRTTQLSHSWTPDPQKLSENNDLLFYKTAFQTNIFSKEGSTNSKYFFSIQFCNTHYKILHWWMWNYEVSITSYHLPQYKRRLHIYLVGPGQKRMAGRGLLSFWVQELWEKRLWKEAVTSVYHYLSHPGFDQSWGVWRAVW